MRKKVVKLNECELREMIHEEVTNVLSEISINAKKRNVNNTIDVFKKGKSGYNNIKTFGVVSAGNADSQEQPRSVNKKDMKNMSDSLKSAHYAFVSQKGHFGGNDEWSYYIFNISFDTLAHYAGMYEQTSFIFSEVRDNEVISHYYEKQDINAPYNKKNNPYILKDTANWYIDATDEIGGKYHYSIPFSIFESVNERIEENLSLINEDKEFAIDFGMNRIGISPMFMRQKIYNGLY